MMPETTQRNMTQPPARPMNGNGAAPRTTAPKVFGKSRGVIRKAWRVGVYGPEGLGKSSLAAMYPGKPWFVDIEGSTKDLDVQRIEGVNDWMDLRAFVQQAGPEEFPTFVIDSMTRAEDWCANWVIKNKVHSSGIKATDNIEDFPYKAGLTFLIGEFGKFLGDLDAAHNRGCNVLMIAHNRISRFRNPDGSDYFRNEPRLTNEEKGSSMLPWIQMLDHLLFIDSDVSVDKGKAKGSGSRTIYSTSTPSRMAKTRTLSGDPVVFTKGDDSIWQVMNTPAAVTADDAPPM